MNEDPLLHNCMEPHSLVLTQNICDYCSKPAIRLSFVHYMFGIKYCEEHKSWAIRDCGAYMHINGMIKLNDALKDSRTGPFIHALKESKGFPVMRSSGILQDGWKLNDGGGVWELKYQFIYIKNGEIIIPVMFDIVTDTMMKHVPLNHFMKPEIMEKIGIEKEAIDNFQSAILSGFYKADYIEQLHIKNTSEDNCYKDPDTIVTCSLNGKQIRAVFVPIQE